MSMALDFGVTDLERAVYAKAVEKCGSKVYWSSWAEDVGQHRPGARGPRLRPLWRRTPVAAGAMASFSGPFATPSTRGSRSVRPWRWSPSTW